MRWDRWSAMHYYQKTANTQEGKYLSYIELNLKVYEKTQSKHYIYDNISKVYLYKTLLRTILFIIYYCLLPINNNNNLWS